MRFQLQKRSQLELTSAHLRKGLPCKSKASTDACNTHTNRPKENEICKRLCQIMFKIMTKKSFSRQVAMSAYSLEKICLMRSIGTIHRTPLRVIVQANTAMPQTDDTWPSRFGVSFMPINRQKVQYHEPSTDVKTCSSCSTSEMHACFRWLKGDSTAPRTNLILRINSFEDRFLICFRGVPTFFVET